jgi:succinylglutamate desuccinylase
MNDIITILGQYPGPKTVILGSVHGNETIGKKIIDQLSQDLDSKNILGQLVLIFGNPKAYEQNVRFIDEDMNRLLGEQKNSLQVSSKASLNSYEKNRLAEILPYLQNVDYLLDIHSTILPSVPFVFCEDMAAHTQLAKIFNTQYIVSPAAKKNIPELRVCFDNYADRQGGIGLTYEAGQIGNEENWGEVYEKVLNFLEVVGTVETRFIASQKNMNVVETKNITIHQALIPETNNFQFVCEQRTFLPLKKDDLIATDGETNFFAPSESYLIFPKKNPLPGTIAGYVASVK